MTVFDHYHGRSVLVETSGTKYPGIVVGGWSFINKDGEPDVQFLIRLDESNVLGLYQVSRFNIEIVR